MCVVLAPPSPPTLVRRALDAEGAARRRARCLRGAAINAALLLALAADLSWKCPGYTSVLHWVELACAGVAGANLLRLALGALRPLGTLPLRVNQRRLLALTDPALDSSFRLEEPSVCESVSSLSPYPSDEELSLSLSPARLWGAGGVGASPPPSPDLTPPPPPRDRFIADRRSLADYLQQYERRQQTTAGGLVATGGAPSPPLRYQLSAGQGPGAGPGPGGAEGEAGEGGKAEGDSLAMAARRLHLDPTRLTEYNLNLRVWLHVTILERLVREIDSVEGALARLGLGGALAEWPAERLRALAAGGAHNAHAPPRLRALLPYVAPWAARAHVLRRLRALAAGGALSAYRGALPAAGAGAGAPTDAEVLLHVFATYMDGQLCAGGAPSSSRPFSAAFVSRAPAPPPRPLALHLSAPPPAAPHYVVAVHGAVLDVCRSPRSNLLHALLVFLAAAARHPPGPLRATHLGRNALNLLWVIGR